MNLNKKKSGSFPGGKVCLYSSHSLFKEIHTNMFKNKLTEN